MKPSRLEQLLIEALKQGPQERTVLVEKVSKEAATSLQGSYKALRHLRARDIVITHGKEVSLSLWWIDHELTRWNQIAQAYNASTRSQAFHDLRAGESLKLRFRTLKELDLYWTHAYLLLEETVNPKFPTYSVAPHDWFPLARPGTDELWIKRQEARAQRVVLTHPLPLDKIVLNERRKQGVEVMLDANPFHQKENEYKNLIHDWIFEVKLDEAINKQLIRWLQSTEHETEEQKKKIQEIITLKGKCIFKISRAPKRASVMTKKIAKYFE